jgi:hypothetical protein
MLPPLPQRIPLIRGFRFHGIVLFQPIPVGIAGWFGFLNRQRLA